ncbi:response regulator [Cronbergia sp. UHCC 0137]|uniref:response regulator n=1 Tax=Cronbergia sp. UHCC 0137 TaxID=3110239 RepID=UPI002B1EC73D|nr:response regulator [Cronbergia sp. UHCC 0137]MEA5616704.1 response regulator [Cronbergia sp. UHCC 0137]
MQNNGTITQISPTDLLRQFSNSDVNACLQILSNSVEWLIYIEQGKIIYATHSVEPFDRLERHIRRLSQQIPLLRNEITVQLRLMFEPDLLNQSRGNPQTLPLLPPEYQAICWLVSQEHLTSTQAALLIQELVKEVIESLLLIQEGIYELTELPPSIPKICKLDGEIIIERCLKRLQSWQFFAPQIISPYQRPYLLMKGNFYDKKLPELHQNLTSWMKGFSLRHLAVIMNQDEILLAQSLYPHIKQGSIILHEADPPFDKLPQINVGLSHFSQNGLGIAPNNNISVANLPEIAVLPTDNLNSATKTAKKVYKIISVDDSPTILKQISRCLEDEAFSLVAINEPVKAVMSIIRHKPDLILLDLNMAGIDGYELCRIIRNNSMFKEIPIIFVTGNKGIVDKVKARLVGASGYLTKPFNRTELLKMIFSHLA